jgi:hypothetical protein
LQYQNLSYWSETWEMFLFFGKSKSITPEYIMGYTGHSMIWPQQVDKDLPLNQFYYNQVWLKDHK